MPASCTIYGIKNCDTMKKTMAWLDKRRVAYTFHDYKKSGIDAVLLASAIKALGWEQVINRKGTTWRSLPESTREKMTEKSALATALDNPSLVKRPLLVYQGRFHAGFDEALYAKIFS